MEEYIMYLRKSQMDRDFDDVSVEETLRRHKTILLEFATRQRLPIAEILEEVVSGESLSARPQMMRCLEMVNTGRYAGVVCMDIDRLSRGSSLDSGYITQVLQVNHCKIITPGKVYDLENDSDEQFTDMKFMFSRYELRAITKRLVRGRNQSASEGKYLGSRAPYGYSIVKLPGVKGNSLKPNPQEAPIVKLIYDWYTKDHIGYITIANKLNEMGCHPQKGGDWTAACVTNVLGNVVYTGRIRWRRYVTDKVIADGKLTKIRKRLSQYDVYDGMHDALISDEQYQEAQDIKHRRVNPSVKYDQTIQNPFAGILVCAGCGQRMLRKTYNHRAHTEPRYRCGNPNCVCKSIMCRDVESAVIKEMRSWLADYIIKLDQSAPQDDHLQPVLEGLQQHLSDIKAQQDKICDLLEQGVYSVELFAKRNGALDDDIKKTTKSIRDLQAQIEASKAADELRAGIVPTAQHLLDNYDDLTQKEKNDLWKVVLEKVTCFRSETGGDYEVAIYPRLPKV